MYPHFLHSSVDRSPHFGEDSRNVPAVRHYGYNRSDIRGIDSISDKMSFFAERCLFSRSHTSGNEEGRETKLKYLLDYRIGNVKFVRMMRNYIQHWSIRFLQFFIGGRE
jgi:hypothetical protein